MKKPWRTRTVVVLVLSVAFVIGNMVPARAATVADSADPDVIVFVNRESLRGRMLQANAEFIEFDSAALGKLTVPTKRVQGVIVSGHRWRLSEARAESGAGRELPGPAEWRRTADAPLPPYAQGEASEERKGLSYVEPRDGPAPTAEMSSNAPQSKSDVTFGISVPEAYVYGTQSQENLGGDVAFTANQTQHIWDPASWLTNIHLTGSHIRTWKAGSTAVTTNVYDGTLLLKNAFSKNGPTAYYGIADLASNNSLGVGLQQSYGGGVSTLVYASDQESMQPARYRLAVTAYGDLRYMHERLYAPAAPLDLIGVRVGEDITYIALDKDKKPRFSITETAWVIPTPNDIHAMQTFGRLQLSWPLGKYLSLGLTEEDDFLNNAPAGKRKNWSKSGATVSFTFPPLSAK